MEGQVVANKYLCTTISTDVLLEMKILSSSPYAAFNPKEWNSLPRTDRKFSSAPVKIKKKFFNNFKNVKSTEITQENNDLPKQIQLAFT